MTSPETGNRLLLIGRGRMGRLVESLSGDYGFHCVGHVDASNANRPDEWPLADVAVDFSTAEAVSSNLPRLAARGIDVVVGTTGWVRDVDALRQVARDAAIGVVAAPNFSLGVNIFIAVVQHAAELMKHRPEFGAWVHEQHHATKRDAPSGTALALVDAMRAIGYEAHIDVTSTRAGSIPGTHTIGFDAPSESIALTHTARDRTAFARGALEAARWVRGRKGWFGMRDVLGL